MKLRSPPNFFDWKIMTGNPFESRSNKLTAVDRAYQDFCGAYTSKATPEILLQRLRQLEKALNEWKRWLQVEGIAWQDSGPNKDGGILRLTNNIVKWDEDIRAGKSSPPPTTLRAPPPPPRTPPAIPQLIPGREISKRPLPLPMQMLPERHTIKIDSPIPEIEGAWPYVQGKMIKRHFSQGEDFGKVKEGICKVLSYKWIQLIFAAGENPGSLDKTTARKIKMNQSDTLIQCKDAWVRSIDQADSTYESERDIFSMFNEGVPTDEEVEAARRHITISTEDTLQQMLGVRVNKTNGINANLTNIEMKMAALKDQAVLIPKCYLITVHYSSPDVPSFKHAMAFAFFSIEGVKKVLFFDPNKGEFHDEGNILKVIRSYSTSEITTTVEVWNRILGLEIRKIRETRELIVSERPFLWLQMEPHMGSINIQLGHTSRGLDPVMRR